MSTATARPEVIPGGYTEFTNKISEHALEVFNKAVNFVGIKYTPLAVSTQVVNGTNYRFFCNARGVYPHAVNHAALIDIYEPPKGTAHPTHIKMC